VRPFLAVVKQTVRASFRSKIFHILLALTVLAVFLLPLTVSSDGTAGNELKLSITYSLTVVTALLSITAVWLGCTGISREIESYRLHMVRVKPVHPALLWAGKWCGVFTVTASIFLISGILIYCLIQYRVHFGTFAEQELADAKQEILTARRVYRPVTPNYRKLANDRYRQLKNEGKLPPGQSSGEVLKRLLKKIKTQASEVPFQKGRAWKYTNLDISAFKNPVFIRYRLYVASASESRQRMTQGIWMVSNPEKPPKEQTAVLPQRVIGGAYHEFSFPAEHLKGTDTFFVHYMNQDPGEENVVFQPDDFPVALIKVTGFSANWVRACFVVLLRLAVLAAVGCLFGVAFSPPVAVFVALAYLVLGVIADPSIGTPFQAITGEVTGSTVFDVIAHLVAVTMDKVVISLNAFDISFLLAKGRLIEISRIARLFTVEVLLKGGLTAALAIWILNKREMGKVIRKS